MLRKLVVGPYQTNCYILGCKETNQGLVIDPGDEVFRIVKEITRSGLTIKYIAITHGHVDHVGGVSELKRITKAPVLIHRMDAAALAQGPTAFWKKDRSSRSAITASLSSTLPGIPPAACASTRLEPYLPETLCLRALWGEPIFLAGAMNCL